MKSLRRYFKKLRKDEEGQSAVLLALTLTVLLGCAALAVDLGQGYERKVKLQNAADAAALAAADLLPDAAAAREEAERFAALNGAGSAELTLTTPYKDNEGMLAVELHTSYGYGFAKIFGLSNGGVTARAVAAKNPPVWIGESLPFINLDDDYLVDSKVVIWESTGPGDYESIWKDDFEAVNLGKNDDHSKGYFKIFYEDGLTVTKGVVANIKEEIGYIYEQNKPQYVFSLRSDVINSGKYDTLKNKLVIPLEDMVLLQVVFDDYDIKGKHMFLTVQHVYDIANLEMPTEYLLADSGSGACLID